MQIFQPVQEVIPEFGMTKDEKHELFAKCEDWFHRNNYTTDKKELLKSDFIKFHWVVDATTILNGKRRTDTFFITPSKLSRWVGFKKEHEVLTHFPTSYKPNKINEMREAVKR